MDDNITDEHRAEVWRRDVTVNAARSAAFREAADMLAGLSASRIRLAAGELTAAEMRAVQAVLLWQSQKMMNRANEP